MPDFYTKKCNANEGDRAEPVKGKETSLDTLGGAKSGNILNDNAAQEGNYAVAKRRLKLC
jgi:hypothetical protein